MAKPLSASPSKVLYRKYRPTSLEEVVGQEQITSALINSLKQGKIAHAYLFIGPRGTGKTSVARILAHAVNSFPYSVEDSYLDIVEIDAASNTGVDNIRELREKAVIAPTKGKYKVYIIDEVHMLTKSASNALLKTLEEPPAHVIFIMATTDAHKVPITISSRTQVFTFRLADPKIMFQHLRKIADAEKIPIDDEALQLIVRRGGGSFRDSLSLLDQITTLSDQTITADILSNALGLPQEETTLKLLEAYSNQDAASIQSNLKDLLSSGLKPEIIASELIEKIVAAPTAATLPLLGALPSVQPPFPEAKLLLALLQFSLSDTPRNPSRPVIQQPPQDQAPAKTPPRTPPEAPKSPNSPIQAPESFDWPGFLEQIRQESTAVYSQLLKVDHELIDQALHLYPEHKFTKTILEKPSHTELMTNLLGNIELVIHEIGTKNTPKDPTLSQVSAIMGNIREIKGDTPF